MTLPVMFLPVFVYWVPLLCIALGAILGDVMLLAVGGFTYLIQYASLLVGRRVFSFHPGKLLFFPLVAIVVLCCFSRALYYYTAKGAVMWRGRSIQIRT